MSLWLNLRKRGVIRVALSYLVIAWLVLQIGDVVLEPLGAPLWLMRVLIMLAIVGFPVALVLAWFFEFTSSGIEFDHLQKGDARPTVRGIRHYADIVVISLLLIVVAVLVVRQQGLVPEPEQTYSIAIFPFEELDSSEDNHFGDGFAETLIQKLGTLQNLVVLSSTSTAEFRDSELGPAEVAEKLDANLLLEGNMRRAGGLLRVDVRLLDGSSGQQLWSESYRRPMEEVFQLQDEISSAIFSTLGLKLTESEVERISRPPTKNVSAYDTYLRASREILESRDPERYPEALQYLYDAIQLDPNFALAHATLVEAFHLTASYRRWDTSWSDFAEEAREAAARAQELDPNLGEAYLAEAYIAQWEQDVEITEHSNEHIIALAEKALELSPNNPRVLKMLSSLAKDPERQQELMLRAARIDPRSGIILTNVAEGYAAARDWEQAEHWLMRAATATNPYFKGAYKYLVEMNIWDSNKLDRAARWGRAYESRYPQDWAAHVAFVRALIQLGAWNEAEDVLERTKRWRDAGDEYIGWVYVHQGPWLALAQGDPDKAAQLAEQDIRESLQVMPTWPDLTQANKALLTSFELLALMDLNNGNSQAALDRYNRAGLNSQNLLWSNHDSRAFGSAVLYSVLHRYTGQEAEAERLLHELLSRLANEQITGKNGKGFTDFTIYAFLGETDAAIQALQEAVDEGYLSGWWSLEHGSFDANYAAVLEDPRYQRLFNQIVARVREMRESYQTNPGLPLDLLLEAGLDSPGNG